MHIRVDGPARLYAGPTDCYGFGDQPWYELGITENGVQVSLNQLTHRVNSDDMGGAEGNPADILIMGTSATIRGVIVKYPNDPTSLGEVFNGLGGLSEGYTVLPGTPLFAGNYGFSLWILGFTTWFYFPKCELASQPREFNISTTERKTSFAFTAQPIHTSYEGYPVSLVYYTGTANYVAPPFHCANGSSSGYFGHGGSVQPMSVIKTTTNDQTTYSYNKYSASTVQSAYGDKYANTDRLYGLSGGAARNKSVDATLLAKVNQMAGRNS